MTERINNEKRTRVCINGVALDGKTGLLRCSSKRFACCEMVESWMTYADALCVAQACASFDLLCRGVGVNLCAARGDLVCVFLVASCF